MVLSDSPSCLCEFLLTDDHLQVFLCILKDCFWYQEEHKEVCEKSDASENNKYDPLALLIIEDGQEHTVDGEVNQPAPSTHEAGGLREKIIGSDFRGHAPDGVREADRNRKQVDNDERYESFPIEVAVLLLDFIIHFITVSVVGLIHRVRQHTSGYDCEWQCTQNDPSSADFVDHECRYEVTEHKCANQKVVDNISCFILFEIIEIDVGVL